MNQPMFSLPGMIILARIPTTIPIKRYQKLAFLRLRQILFVVHMPVRIFIEPDMRAYQYCSALSSKISWHYTICSLVESILLF
jgi:hypothetical protein